MEKLYKRTYWKNAPDKTTPINAENLDNIEAGIDELDNRVVELKSDLINLTDNVLDTKNKLITAKIVDGAYYYGGATASSGYKYAIVPVVDGHEYFISYARFISKQSSGISNAPQTNFTYTADFSGDLYITYADGVPTEWVVYDKAETDGVGIGTLENPALAENFRNQFLPNTKQRTKGTCTVKGDLASGDSLVILYNNLKKNHIYAFNCEVGTLGTVTIGKSGTNYCTSKVLIDSQNVTLKKYSPSETVLTYEHNMTITDNLSVLITVKQTKADITILSGGQSYTITDTTWFDESNGHYYVENTGGRLTNCEFTVSSKDFWKSTWICGDSYLSYDSPKRWTYYLDRDGYLDNVLLNGVPGGASLKALTSLENTINQFGCTPKYLVWALGMNDGSDSADSPNANWLLALNEVKAICEREKIELILCTIPSVPNINHEQKNAYVRASGFRYIDFAKAVGASADGVWYDGLLDTDGVHPTASGGLALYVRAITDMPEMTFE